MEVMGNLKRTNYCNEFTLENQGENVVVAGFVQKVRNLGQLIFVDLRDRTGIVQLAFDDTSDAKLLEKAATIRTEFVIVAKGEVRKRQSINTEIKTGEIEIFVDELKILSVAKTTPFEILDDKPVSDELRLKYRYLDLRRNEMQQTILMRHKIAKATRDYYDENGFLEIETPTLIKATPEGARDFLVPSRVNSGKFFALPQSPQLYKQMLMVSGFDRYMQFARCYRDEDLRADRQPEFTQIDLEMSFVDQEDIIKINEGYMQYIFKKILGQEIKAPFHRMTYDEAMTRYGSDKPDTRFGLELNDLSSGLKDSEFKVFSGPIADGGSVRAINAKGLADKLSRKEIDKLTNIVKLFKGKGLAFLRWTSEAQSSSYEKFLSEKEKEYIKETLNVEQGDLVLIVGDSENNVVFDALGALRLELAKKFQLFDEKSYAALWVTDFPMFEYDKEDKRFYAKHHPFTAPRDEDLELLNTDPEKIIAKAYDLVLNGTEVGGGSLRITDSNVQQKVFEVLGLSKEEVEEKFGFLINAFQYGVPPHGGMAYGFDRLVMLLLEKSSIRDVIAFPKTQNASESMTECPAPVDQAQLDELSIKLNLDVK